ncbi:duodenase-1-like isoform X1 [Chrysemys picta bellii]|uniref:duodenase-1-like isoform X1 n=1 Tax=Chrysemys picta bellii TaxID=8478 RepID=UPI0032B13504
MGTAVAGGFPSGRLCSWPIWGGRFWAGVHVPLWFPGRALPAPCLVHITPRAKAEAPCLSVDGPDDAALHAGPASPVLSPAPWGSGCKITVKLGAHNIREREESQQVILVDHQYLHLDYDKEPHNNDIMLLKLAKRAKLNRWVKTINLPHTTKKVKPGTKCSVAGWGRTVAWNILTQATRLQEVDVEVLEDDKCMYRHYNAFTMMCVGDPEKGKDSAKGDSGGPLVCGKTAQGIVSWGPYCPPGVYTRVSTFITWIQETMRRLQP